MSATSSTETEGRAAQRADVTGQVGDSGAESAPRWGCAALLFGGLCLVVLVAASFATHREERLPFVGVCTVLILAVKGAVDALSRWLRTPLLPVATSAGAVLAAVALAAGQWDAIVTQLDHLNPERDLGEHIFGRGLGPALLAPGAFMLVAMLGVGAGAALTPLARRAGFQRAARYAAAFATLALTVLVTLAAVRAARHPSIDEYLANLQPVGSLDPPGVVTRYGGITGPVPMAWKPGPTGERRHELGALTLVLDCEEPGCRIGLVGPSGAPPSTADARFGAPVQFWDASIGLIADPTTGNLFVLRGHGVAHKRRAVAEFKHRDGRWWPGPFDPTHITNRVSPPVMWIFAAAGGLVLLGVGWHACFRLRRDRARLQQARRGTLGEDGWISFPDGPPVQLDARSLVPPGPVLVVARSGTGGYRGQRGLSAEEVIAGTLAERETELSLQGARYDAAMIAVASLACAPLLAAALVGLLF